MTAALPQIILADVVVPIRVVSEANARDHWAVRHRRAKDHKQQAWMALLLGYGGCPPVRDPDEILPLLVTLTRTGGRRMDTDNLAGAFKHVQDGVAWWLKLDDGDPRLTWRYEQAPLKRGARAGVRIRIERV